MGAAGEVTGSAYSGEPISVNARVATLSGLRGHAGQTELVQWFGALADSRPQLVITHGEDDSRAALAYLISRQYGVEALLPAENQAIVLFTARWRLKAAADGTRPSGATRRSLF